MSRRLPPLNAVRAFEAAARHLSFNKAAAELHVTAAAVSQQVRGLEEWLGVVLFRRLPRGVRLTDAGQGYWRRVSAVLDELADATRLVRREDGSAALTVSTMPSFAARWLIPRLGRFSARHPGIDVRVVASSDLVDFTRDDVDVAVRFGPGNYPGLRVDLLMGEEIFVVCSPALRDGPHPLREPLDLRFHTLLHDLPDPRAMHDLNWAEWLAAVGVHDVDPSRGPRFTYTHMSLQAAAAGQGVALGTSALIADDLATGRLVRPFAASVRSPFSYYVVCPRGTADRPRVAAFRTWMMEEVARDAGAAGG